MKKFAIKVNEVNYKCDDERNGIVEAERRNKRPLREEAKFLAFRNSLEVNGKKYVLTKISAFDWCNMVMISIPSNVANIERGCFRDCKSLCEIVFESDSKLKQIGSFALRDSGLRMVRISSSVENTESGCFEYCL
jgi:hypothetical protein